jgi:hypothetical protein
MALRGVLSGLIRREPDLAVPLVLGRIAGGKVVGAIVDDEFRWLSFACHPKPDIAVHELVVDAGSDLDLDLKRHPLIGKPTEAIPVRRKHPGVSLRIETSRTWPGILDFDVGSVRTSEALGKDIVCAVRGRARARVIQNWGSLKIPGLNDNPDRFTRGIDLRRLIAGRNDRLLNAAAVEYVVCRDELRTEALPPLHVKLGVLSELH